jgi:transcriptional regulator with XRE-family HTH domain
VPTVFGMKRLVNGCPTACSGQTPRKSVASAAVPSSPKRRLGEALRRRRQELGLSQGQLARLLPMDSVDGSAISRWERGQVRPRDETIELLAEALETTFAELMAGGSPEDPENGVAGRRSLDIRMLEALERIEERLSDIHAAVIEQQQERTALRDAVERFDQGLAQVLGTDPRSEAS